jgi:DNA-binding winged helix-turn-helix (wHTH) protein/Flp pilus assembly protein TadD
MTQSENPQWEFGSFRLDGAQNLLFRNGELVALSPKAVDILVLLLEHHGQLVEKEVLMRRVWPDSFVEESNLAVYISQLRKTITEETGSHRIETIPRRGYRFVGDINCEPAPSPVHSPRPANPAGQNSPTLQSESSTVPLNPAAVPAANRHWPLVAVISAACLVGLIFLGLHLRQPPGPPSSAPNAASMPPPRDTIVLADISNNTGDPVFNTTLRQGLAIELEQSPFLRLVPESRIQQSLRLMGKPANEPLTPDTAREICQRNGSQAMINGWIARLGTEYVLGVRAVNCRTGDNIADLQTSAAGKELVLKALGDVTGQLRARLGESLSTVQRFDTPIEEATTSSLEALQAYSVGVATMVQKGESSSCVPFFQRAIRLDPDFAIAYAALGNAYSNLGEMGLASANLRRAYQLRQRVSEREKLYIESHFHELVTGDLSKATTVYQTWAATYPEDSVPRVDLALIDSDLGKFDLSLQQAGEALRLAPTDTENYGNLANAYIALDRYSEAHAAIDQAFARKLESSDLHIYLYDLAFLQHDPAAMQRQVTWAAGEPGIEDLFLGHYADTLAFNGEISKARQITDRATEAATRADQKETAAGYEVAAAQREALFGNLAEARHQAAAALALAHDRDTQYGAALALAFAGSVDQANTIASQLNKDFPDDTFVQFIYLPALRGTAALQKKNPSQAIQSLDAASPYELGAFAGGMPAYIRGLAFLQSGDGPRAQAEFEKIVAHPGALLSSPLMPLAHLQLARAFLLQGNQPKAKSEYQDFLARWKEADPDIPILQSAKSEYAKLSQPGSH